MIKKDPTLLVQATQALDERIRAQDEKWISLLLWIGADPRLSVEDLKIDDYKRTPLEQAVRSGNLRFLKKANIDPKRDNILSLLDQAGWSPEPEIIEYLLSFSADLSRRLEDGKTILESYIRNLYYVSSFTFWRLDLDKLISCIEKISRRGARWCPSERSDYNTFRAALRKMERYKAISVLERFVEIDLFGPGTFRVLMSTPAMKDLLATDSLRAAAGCKNQKQRSKRTGSW